MTRVAFIGLGNMGSGMAANQAKAGREVVAFDLSADALSRAKEQGMKPASSAAEACNDADIVITMLPAGQHVRQVYADAILPNARKVVVVEASSGQLEDELRLALSHAELPPPPLSHVRRQGGVLPSQAEIVQHVLNMEGVR